MPLDGDFIGAFACGTAAMFGTTGALKLRNVGPTRDSIQKVLGVSVRFSGVVAYALASCELLVALAVLTRRTREFGLIGSLGLLVLFLPYVMVAKRKGASCGCSGGAGKSTVAGNAEIVRSTLLLILGTGAVLASFGHAARFTALSLLGPLVMFALLLLPTIAASVSDQTEGALSGEPQELSERAVSRRGFLARIGIASVATILVGVSRSSVAYALSGFANTRAVSQPAPAGGINRSPISPTELLAQLTADPFAQEHLSQVGSSPDPSAAYAEQWSVVVKGTAFTADVLAVILAEGGLLLYSPNLGVASGSHMSSGLIVTPKDDPSIGQLTWVGATVAYQPFLDPTLPSCSPDTVSCAVGIIGVLGCSTCITSPGFLACTECAAASFGTVTSCLNECCLGVCECAAFYACQAVNEGLPPESGCYRVGPSQGCPEGGCSCGGGRAQVCFCEYYNSDGSFCGCGCCCTDNLCGYIYTDLDLIAEAAQAINQELAAAGVSGS